MPGTAVGLYCAVVDRFDLLVSTRMIAARETQAVFNQRAGSLRTWLGALNLGSGEGWQGESESRAERPRPDGAGLQSGRSQKFLVDHHGQQRHAQLQAPVRARLGVEHHLFLTRRLRDPLEALPDPPLRT